MDYDNNNYFRIINRDCAFNGKKIILYAKGKDRPSNYVAWKALYLHRKDRRKDNLQRRRHPGWIPKVGHY